MPHYRVTGMHSHRHPFYGYGADATIAADGTVKAPVADKVDMKSALAPVWAGLIMGLASYSLASAMGIESHKARGLGLALGATIAIGQIGSAWLQGYLDKAKVPAPAPAPASAAPATVVPPTSTAESGFRGW